MAALLDKDLSGDMLKLVRYKVLFVRREFEVAFPEHEDFVSDNLTESSFVAWKIAEFIQDLEARTMPVPSKWRSKQYPAGMTTGEFLKGIPHEDKKYLRVYFEVLERYPREAFKYEEQQIRVLGQIRDALKPPARPDDPYNQLLDQLQTNAQIFNTWRESFRRCAAGIAQALSGFFEQSKDLGAFQTPAVSAKEIENAVTNPASTAQETLDLLAGSGDNLLQVFIRKEGMPPADVDVPPNHSVRSSAMESTHPAFTYLQKVAESYSQRVDPEDPAAIRKALADNQVDLHAYAYSDRLGLVSWSSLNQGGPLRMRAIAYPLDGKILLFKQMLKPDLTPWTGPMPQAEFVEVVPDQFIVAIDFELEQAGKKSVCTCAMPVNFDFANCSAAFLGLVLKFRRTG